MPVERSLGAHREFIRQPDGSWRVDPWDGRSFNDKVESLLDYLGMKGGVPLSTEAALTSIAITMRQILNRMDYDAVKAQHSIPTPPKPTEITHLPEGVTGRDLIEALQYALGGNFRGWPT
jgi:hypothetical protein